MEQPKAALGVRKPLRIFLIVRKYSNTYLNSYWVEQLKDSKKRLQDKLFFSLKLGFRLSQKEFCKMEGDVQYTGNPIISRNTLKAKEIREAIIVEMNIELIELFNDSTVMTLDFNNYEFYEASPE